MTKIILINNMEICDKNTFISVATMTPNAGMRKSGSCSNLAEMEEKIKQGEWYALKEEDISTPCDTDTGDSSGELGSMESTSIGRRRAWDEYSIEGAVTPSDCTDAIEGDNHADSTFAEQNDVPQITNQCYWAQTMEVSTNWFPETMGPYGSYTCEYPSQILGRVPRGVGRVIVPGPQQQVDKSLVPNTESTRLRRPSGSSKRKRHKRKRRNRWEYDNWKNRVTLLVDPRNDLPIPKCIKRCIGTNGDHIKALTECYNGAFVRVEAAAYPCVHADGSTTMSANTMCPLMSLQISAPYVDSFLKCREKTLKWIYTLFPAAVVSESEEGMMIKSFSMHV